MNKACKAESKDLPFDKTRSNPATKQQQQHHQQDKVGLLF